MLKPAILYKDEITQLYHSVCWFNDKYKYYNYSSYWHTFTIEERTWDWHEFVSVDKHGKLLGYISYRVDRITMNCSNFCAVNFTDNPIYGKDLLQAVKDIFERFNFHKLTFGCVVGNPVERTYDRLCAKYGGCILCIEKEETKLDDNKYYDVKRYQIMRDDYMKARRSLKRRA